MNPKDYAPIDFNVADFHDSEEEDRMARLALQVEKARQKSVRERAEKARQAYRDLCGALGVESLNASIDTNSTHITVPVAGIEQIAARIESLKTNVLAEGAL